MTRFSVPPFAAFPEPDDPVWPSLDRYLAGAATPADRAQVEQWCARDPERREAVAAWGEAWRRLSPGERTSPEALQRIADEILAPRVGKLAQTRLIGGEKRGGWGTQTLRGAFWIGALALVVVGLGLTFTRHIGKTHANVVRVYTTRPYQQAILNLNDGTRVTLAPQTTVRVLQFGARGRTVTLDRGEAYFEVTHATASPFVVRSGSATAQVLGTEFLMRRETGNTHLRVAVADGKVRVTKAAAVDTGITLTKGQVGDVTDSTAQVSTTDDVTPGIEWAQGCIMFRHAPLETVLQTVSRWYGYHFMYADKALSAHRVTMIVSTRSSAEALAAIEQVLAVNLTVVGDTVTLVPQPSKKSHGTPRIRTYDVWTPAQEVGR